MTSTGWQPSDIQLERNAYRHARNRRAIQLSVGLTVVVTALVVSIIGTSTGWHRVQGNFFDLPRGWAGLGGLLRAFWLNVQIMLISEVFVLVIGALVALLRTLPGPAFLPIRALMTLYVDVFRGLPLLIVLYLIGFGIPGLRLSAAPTSPFTLCIITLVLTYSAYNAEVFRAGIESVHPSQRAAARSLGLNYAQSMRFVVFPQAVRRVLPPLLNDFVSLQKDTVLVSTLGVIEVLATANNQRSQDYKFVHLVFAGLLFLLLTIPLTRLTDWWSMRAGWLGGAVR